MQSKTGKFLFGLAIFLLLGASAQAGTFTATANGDWSTAATWTLNSGTDADGIPDADDTVTIPTSRVVTVTGAQSVRILTVNNGGTLTLNAASTLTMDGTAGSSISNGGAGAVGGTGVIRTQGATSLSIGGAFSAPLEIISGTTTAGSVTSSGAITVLSGATLQVAAGGFVVTHTGNLTVSGILNIGSSSTFSADGANVVNNGSITGNNFRFNGTTQNLSGSGSFTNSSTTIISGSTVTLTSNLTIASTNFTINGGGALAIGGNTLTLNGVIFSSGGTVTGTGSGLIRTQGATSLSIAGTFSAPLEIFSGTTTTGSITSSGAINILSGATLQVAAGGFVVTHTGDLTVGGTLTIGSSSTYSANGANIVNNGSITGNNFRFNGTTQNLSGTGSFTNSNTTVFNLSTVTLTSDMTVGNGVAAISFAVNNGGILTLSGSSILNLNRVTFTNDGTTDGSGTLRTQGASILNSAGTIAAPLVIASDTTTANSVATSGAIDILSGATLQVAAGGFVVTHTGDLTVGGTLNIGSSSTFNANGANVVNNGSITGNNFRFNGTTNLSGTGSFTNTTTTIFNPAIVTLTSNLTIASTNFTINNGGALAVSGNTLTLNGVIFSSGGAVSSTESGLIRTQGTTSLSITGAFSASLEINSGTTTSNSVVSSGAINILSGATLQVAAGGFTITHTGNLTVGGTLTIGSSSIFNANGANIVNNGSITGANLQFNGTTNLSGSGAFTNANTTITNGSTVTLGSNHQLNTLTINNGGAFNTAAFTAFLSGAGTPLVNISSPITGNFTYNGTAAQTVQSTSVTYNQLGINNAAGVTLTAAETVSQRLTLTNGAFNNGAFLTLADNATIARDNGTLQTAPTIAVGSNINVEYFGANTITTGVELPTGFRLNTLTMNKTGGATVTLDKDANINVALTLTSGNLITTTAFSVLINTTATSSGSAASFVIGAIEKFFGLTNLFTYHVGTSTGYSPVTINRDLMRPAPNNAVAGASSFAVRAENGVIPGSGLNPAKTLQRYWNLSQNGITQADITFQYPQTDVPLTVNNESQFRFARNDGGTNNSFFIPTALDTTNNIATLNDVTQFSPWTLNELPLLSAPANISGHITRSNGSAVAGVQVRLVGSDSSTVVKTTDASGNYLFPSIPTGETYVITAARRGFIFSPASRVLNHSEENNNLNFVGTRDLSTQTATSGSDFDGDGRADLAVFRPSDGTWYLKRSSDDSIHAERFGANGDVPTAGDYDGDGTSDYAVYRPADNVWYLLRSSDQTFSAQAFGADGDSAAHGDYDGDGKTDRAVYRPGEGVWYIWQSGSERLRAERFGLATDKIVPADYDGDGKTDVAVYRPSSSDWYILRSSDGQFRAARFGIATDEPVSADFDGDGKTDIAVYRRSEGIWHILKSSDGIYQAIRWGASRDTLVPADYDGDGKADAAIWRNGDWHILFSGDGRQHFEKFGQANDQPIPKAF